MTPESITSLNRLLAIQCRSFPQYLQWSRPYVPRGREEIMETILTIVADQDAIADRISHMLQESNGWTRTGDFPMEFTDLHDLNIDFLLNAAVNYQEQDVEIIDSLVQQLSTSPAAKAVAEESLGMAKGHLDLLRELLPTSAAS
ncbi:hypothetical protein [Adhaeretor mobilis]|uniref:Uncharacterized protein n=1 Tax=Adhaeretor mobilis TaxID=1930276 RepID=A0A517MV06_9BACT|nr:hypothetical protein [Adhaeretor mobilis]QDS98711.1 hypothetical protein HG15A2_19930 [Adhaeretor mobilis]